MLEDAKHDAHQFFHTGADDDLAGLGLGAEALGQIAHKWITAHGGQRRHIQLRPYTAIAHFADGRTAMHRGTRTALLRGQPYERHRLGRPVKAVEAVGFGQYGLNGHFAHAGEAAQELALVL